MNQRLSSDGARGKRKIANNKFLIITSSEDADQMHPIAASLSTVLLCCQQDFPLYGCFASTISNMERTFISLLGFPNLYTTFIEASSNDKHNFVASSGPKEINPWNNEPSVRGPPRCTLESRLNTRARVPYRLSELPNDILSFQ